jgi:hypothetical protein
MSTLAEIRDAIAELSVEERAELIAELCGWEDDEWDKEMETAAAAGKFDQMNREALEDLRAGRCTSLEEGL